MNLPKLLIVDDDDAIRTQLRYALRDEYEVLVAEDRIRALRCMRQLPALVVLDLGLPPDAHGASEGLRTLEEIVRTAPLTKVVVITGNGDRANAYRALSLGAFDFHVKPVDVDALITVLRRAWFQYRIHTESGQAPTGAGDASPFEEILGASPQMRHVLELTSVVAKTDATVLLQGESGTGKELVARAIHARSRRASSAFVPINCGAIPETLLESELFGHEKGAYTGAHIERKGKLEIAAGGTLFLDEAAEMSLLTQVKLLRFLQEREIERVGGRDRIAVDTRIIAAANKDLRNEVAAGRFREDLYFRLSVVTIRIPPLRERAEDVLLLATTFLRRNCREYRRRLEFSAAAHAALTKHPWPGNVRELENRVQRAVIMARGRLIEPPDLELDMIEHEEPRRAGFREARNRFERELLVSALTATKGNVSRAAKELGISRASLHELLDKLTVDAKVFRRGLR